MWLGWRIRKAWKNFLFSRIRRRGQLGEENAIKILKKSGYEVVQSQVSFPGYMFVDDLKQDFDVRPDFIVEKDGLKYLAEVKTGDAALTKNRGTRRQLLEYTKALPIFLQQFQLQLQYYFLDNFLHRYHLLSYLNSNF